MRLAALLLPLALVAAGARAEDEGIPRYRIERLEVSGNRRTATALIRGALLVRPGDVVAPDDPRLEASRYKVLALGLFIDVRLRLERGHARGHAVLVVEVAERGTLVIDNLWFGSSRAVEGWGGLELTDTNFAGRGLTLGAAALATSAPEMPGAHVQQAYRLHFADDHIGRTALGVAAGLLYNNASEPYRVAGADSDGRPSNFAAFRYRRIGGLGSLGIDIGTFMRVRVDYRLENIEAQLPAVAVRTFDDGSLRPVDLGLRDGSSWLSTVAFTFERDTRADPVLTPAGSRLRIANELGTRLLGSTYEYYKLTVQYQQWWRLRWGHVLSFGGLVGVIVGAAPIYERYYLGDLDPLLPARALGLTLSTLPPRDLLRSGITRERYGPLAGRLLVEYAVPLFRGRRWIHGGDAFVAVGLVAVASYEDFSLRAGDAWQAVPLDLLLDAGVRLDTFMGSVHLTLGNVLARTPY
jgi:outer membrane protein assembly factor BamA